LFEQCDVCFDLLTLETKSQEPCILIHLFRFKNHTIDSI
jgi:hypothetical protein